MGHNQLSRNTTYCSTPINLTSPNLPISDWHSIVSLEICFVFPLFRCSGNCSYVRNKYLHIPCCLFGFQIQYCITLQFLETKLIFLMDGANDETSNRFLFDKKYRILKENSGSLTAYPAAPYHLPCSQSSFGCRSQKVWSGLLLETIQPNPRLFVAAVKYQTNLPTPGDRGEREKLDRYWSKEPRLALNLR